MVVGKSFSTHTFYCLVEVSVQILLYRFVVLDKNYWITHTIHMAAVSVLYTLWKKTAFMF